MSGTIDYTKRTYDYYDNQNLLALGKMMNPNPPVPIVHPLAAPATNNDKFYRTIQNLQIATNTEGVAYNQDTFLLISAGKDGLFGTSDDIKNFGE